MKEASKAPAAWSALLAEAVSKPGLISTAYSRFWNYSVGNQLLALWQCMLRGIEPGPINTFLKWKDLGRSVRKGEKALTLCMPVTISKKFDREAVNPLLVRTGDGAERQLTGPGGIVPEDGTIVTRRVFVYKPHWFVLGQTDGQSYTPAALPEWHEDQALRVLGIERVPFTSLDGNVQGYAAGQTVSVSPVAFYRERTLFHELAHVILGHTAEGELTDSERTPKNLREVEAEAVALICCESLRLGRTEYSRGYLQHWLSGETIPERSAHRIFSAADRILRSGRPCNETATAPEDCEVTV